jgi:hypothetical protein
MSKKKNIYEIADIRRVLEEMTDDEEEMAKKP